MTQSWVHEMLADNSFTDRHEAIYAAIRDDNIVDLERLLAAGPAVHLVRAGGFGDDLRTASGWSYPLHLASWLGNLDAVRKLLDAGADPTTRERIPFGEGYDVTPLYLAIENGHRAIVKTLWEAGAAADSMVAQTTGRFSYPRLAATAGQAAVVRDLLSWKQWGLEIKLSALEAATRCWRFAVVDELLQPGSYFEHEDLFPALHQAVHYAVSFRQPYADELYPEVTSLQYVEQQMLIERLIDAGADPDFYMGDRPPLIRAAEWGPDSLGAVRTLLNNGVNVDLEDQEGNTAFMSS
ncbi:ankyrin [Sarocladium strictum]